MFPGRGCTLGKLLKGGKPVCRDSPSSGCVAEMKKVKYTLQQPDSRTLQQFKLDFKVPAKIAVWFLETD